MAKLHVTLVDVRKRANSNVQAPDSVEIAADTMTLSGTSAQSTITAAALGLVWEVTAQGGAAFIKFGANPTAVADAGHLIADGQTRNFNVTTAGELIAAIEST